MCYAKNDIAALFHVYYCFYRDSKLGKNAIYHNFKNF